MTISNSAVAAKLAVNPLFPELMNRISSLPVGTDFTIRGCFSDVEWGGQLKETRLSLGRLFKNNVDSQNITGVEAINRQLTNNTQKYRVIGPIAFVEKFMMNYSGFYDNYGIFTQELYQSENDAILFYKVEKQNKILDIEVICKKCTPLKETLFNVSKKIKIANGLDTENPHISAVISIWFSLTALWFHESQLSTEGINNIAICSSNRSMLERCSGYRTDTSNNIDYEAIIQSYFKDFILGNRMELNYKINAISLDQSTYRKLVSTF